MQKHVPLAEFYSKWWRLAGYPERQTQQIIELEIVCANCLMLTPPVNRPTRDKGPFSLDAKCCRYIPFLPNFTIGALLENASAELRARLKVMMQLGDVLPLGIFPREPETNQVCPFFSRSNGGCSIWSFRPAVCSSYHCISSKGEEGFKHWRQIEMLGNELEWTLAHEVAWRQGLTDDDLRVRDQKIWQSIGDPLSFYQSAWQCARDLDEQTLRAFTNETMLET